MRRNNISSAVIAIMTWALYAGLLSAADESKKLTARIGTISVKASSVYPGGKGDAGCLIDGNTNTTWAGDPAANTWALLFDLDSVMMIPGIRVEYFSDVFMARSAVVHIGDDVEHMNEAGTLPNVTPAVLTLNKSARFIKFVFTDKAHNKQPAIREVTFGTITDGEVRGGAIVPEVPGWPAGVKKIVYHSDADATEQPALFYRPDATEPVPLLVALHTWGGNYMQAEPEYAKWCIAHGWAMLHPNFRGPNNNPEACGSEHAVKDILSAVTYAKTLANIDQTRVYLVGASGGGHMAMLMAGRSPETWAAVSAWCGISDLKEWYVQTRAAKLNYADMLKKVCSGTPGESSSVDDEYARRSPIIYIASAKKLPLDINAGIHDGHTGSVPVSHSLLAYNMAAAEADRIPADDIDFMTANRSVPTKYQKPENDPYYGKAPVLFRKISGNTRISVFDGGHVIIHAAALAWLEQQRKDEPARWQLPVTKIEPVIAPSGK
ncbi:MAG: prolyl oligopeptidase family serine peptidase [Spirochaetes bacterium]|nr:prolyl oligopeptidase family serine peptidase [Spirochaetota bacterium]